MSIIATNAFKVIEGRPVTSSRIVAEYFDKRHNDVLRSIRDLIEKRQDLTQSFIAYEENVATHNGATRATPAFLMDRKGFCILAMGFTGAKALEFKCVFYDEFDRMERELNAQTYHGQYETLSTTEQYEIRKAVKSRAKNSSIHYQTIYNALYDYFKIASYKDLTQQQFQPAITFIQTCELKPQLPALAIPEGAIILEKSDAERIRNFVYYLRYLFRPQLDAFEQFLKTVDSPLASKFWDLIHETNFETIELTLDRYGYSVKDLPCYKSLTNKKA